VLLALALPAEGRAQVLREIRIDDDLAARERWDTCWDDLGEPRLCRSWEPVGFTFGGILELAHARTFARVPATSRIVAATRFLGRASLLYTDDLGATWLEARWPTHDLANAVAFDERSSYGVAVGDGGRVWSTTDRGATWRERRSGAGIVYTDVAVVGRIAVFVDSSGAVWRSRDGGFLRDGITRSYGAALAVVDDAIVISTERGTIRVLRDGSVVR
jgi:photosystem II stability/assembly factor-like uncharacterized protein